MAFKISIEGDESDAAEALRRLGVAGKDSAGDLEKTDAASKKLSDTLEKMEKDSEQSADALEKLAVGEGAANQVTEAFGATSTAMQGASDIMTVLGEQFGVSLGPAQQWVQASADLAGGLEGAIGGGKALFDQFGPMVVKMGPVIASTWAHVAALTAQAAAMIAANLPLVALIAVFALLAVWVVQIVRHWDELTAKFPLLAAATETVKAGLQGFVDWITGTFIPVIGTIYDPAIKVPLDLIVSYFTLQFNLVKTGVETAMGVIKGVIDVFMGLITGDWERMWAGLKQIVDSLTSGVKETFGLLVTFFTDDIGPKLMGAGKAMGGALMGGLKDALSATAGFAGGVADAVLNAVKGVVNNFVIDPINGALRFSFDTHIPGVGSITVDAPDIPRLAKGGIVPATPGGRLIIAGEGGDDEAVIPMKELQALQGGASGGSGGVTPIGGAGYSVTIPGVGQQGGLTSQQVDDWIKILGMADEVQRRIWWADPKNASIVADLKNQGYQLINGEVVRTAWNDIPGIAPGMTPAPAYSPGIEGGSSLPTPNRPSGGQSGAAAGGGAPAAGGGGGAKADASTDLLEKIERRLASIQADQEKGDKEHGQLLRQIDAKLSNPIMSLTVNGATGANLQQLAKDLAGFMMVELDKLYGRQAPWVPS